MEVAGVEGLELSLGVPNFGPWGDLPALVELARAADDAGVDRLVVSDHVVLGRNLDAYAWGRFPIGPEAPWLEPLTCLTAFAAVTSRVRLATGILIAPLRPAVVLAKTVATLDVLSGGRVDLGVGVGWQREEYDAAGLDFADRGKLLDDTIGACRELWSRMPASYSSSSVSFSDVSCSPQPVQRPLPVWFSGTLTSRNVRRITELGEGWIPIMGATLEDIRAGVDRLGTLVERPLAVQAPLPLARGGDGAVDLYGTMAGVTELAAAGVSNAYVNVASLCRNAGDAAEAMPMVVAAFRETLR